jgi:hypothetical protein
MKSDLSEKDVDLESVVNLALESEDYLSELIAYFTRVDKENKFEKMFERDFGLMDDIKSRRERKKR